MALSKEDEKKDVGETVLKLIAIAARNPTENTIADDPFFQDWLKKPGGLSELYDLVDKHHADSPVKLLARELEDVLMARANAGRLQNEDDKRVSKIIRDRSEMPSLLLDAQKHGDEEKGFAMCDEVANRVMSQPGGLTLVYDLTFDNAKPLKESTKEHLLKLMLGHCIRGSVDKRDEVAAENVAAKSIDYGLADIAMEPLEMEQDDEGHTEVPRRPGP